jgi:hypothetical protein
VRRSIAVLGGFVALSFCYFGLRLLPHFGRELVGFGSDPQIFVWSFAWWPHALLHGQNPFVTHAIFAPEGISLAWATTVPLLAIVFAPVTLAFGPVAAYNACAILLPALAAWTAFLLCRELTGRFWPSVAGGYLFGFSAYELGQTLGHVHMTAVFLLPLIALVLVRRGAGLWWQLGLLFAAQAWISTELLLTAATALVVGLALAYALERERRHELRALARPLGLATLLAALLAVPLLVEAGLHFETSSINRPEDFGADLLGFVVPTRLVQSAQHWAPSISDRFLGNDAERGAYLGLPALVLAAWYARRAWGRPGTRLLVAAAALAAACSLGTALWVDGHRIVALPWAAVAFFPPFTNVLPVRLAVFTALAVAALAALALARLRPPVALAAGALAILAVVPTVRLATWSTEPQRVAFFSDGLYRSCFKSGDVVFALPLGGAGSSSLWQAESDFGFRLAGGYVRPTPPWSYLRYPAIGILHFEGTPPSQRDLRQLFSAKHVTRVVVPTADEAQWRAPLAFLGSPRAVGGVDVYPGCA